MEPAEFVMLLDSAARRRVCERAYEKGAQLFRRGDKPGFMYYVVSGEARLLRHSPAGAEVVLQRARRGFLAEASLEQPAYHCDGVAVERTQTLAVPIPDFRAALAHEGMRALWLRNLGNELRRVRAHSERLALRSAKDRIIHFIETEGCGGTVVLSQPKKRWAAELGLTHEALYRALGAMREAGTLEVVGLRLKLCDPQEG